MWASLSSPAGPERHEQGCGWADWGRGLRDAHHELSRHAQSRWHQRRGWALHGHRYVRRARRTQSRRIRRRDRADARPATRARPRPRWQVCRHRRVHLGWRHRAAYGWWLVSGRRVSARQPGQRPIARTRDHHGRRPLAQHHGDAERHTQPWHQLRRRTHAHRHGRHAAAVLRALLHYEALIERLALRRGSIGLLGHLTCPSVISDKRRSSANLPSKSE